MAKRIWKNPNTKRGANSAKKASRRLSKNLIRKMGRWTSSKRITEEIKNVMESWAPGSTASSEILFNALLQFYPEFRTPKSKNFTSSELKKELKKRMAQTDRIKLFSIESYVKKIEQNRKHILSLEPELIELDNSIKASKKKVYIILADPLRDVVEKPEFKKFGDILLHEYSLLKKIERKKSAKLTQGQKTALRIMQEINLRDLNNIKTILTSLKD